MRSFAVLVSCVLCLDAASLKIVIMAGQSNMQGHGYVDRVSKGKPNKFTLEQLVKSNPGEYGKLKTNGEWVSRHDVWVYYTDEGSLNPSPSGTWHGELTVGYAGNDGRDDGKLQMGPELGFGWELGDALHEQVLLLKTAWGGKDIDVDFRPPSMPQGEDTGYFYRKMVSEVRDVLQRLPSLFPEYSGSYELAGFAWHQGWNDACGTVGGGPDSKNCESKKHCFQPDPSRYEDNLVALIKDLRKEFSDLPGGKTLPVSVGVSGMQGWGTDSHINWTASDPESLGMDLGGVSDNFKKYIIPAQLAVGDAKLHPEFAGNVLTAETRDFYYNKDVSPGNQGYHWNNNCDSYWRVGKAMGRNMVKLINGGPGPTPTPTPAPTPTPTPASCSFLEGVGVDSYTDRIVASSRDECCNLCLGKVGCTQAVYQHGKCKFSDSSAAQVAVSDAVLCKAGATGMDFLV